MLTYMSLMKLTEQGLKDTGNAKSWIQASCKFVEAMGGRIIIQHCVGGEYDYVAFCEFPSEEVVINFIMTLCSLGYVRATATPVFAQEVYGELGSEGNLKINNKLSGNGAPDTRHN